MKNFTRVHDISITVKPGMAVYPGDPPFGRRSVYSLSRGDSAEVSAFDICAHAGTHLDLPAHFLAGEPTMESLPPERFFLPAVVADNGPGECVEAHTVESSGACRGEALLLRTVNSSRGILTGSRFVEDYVYLTPEAATVCADLELSLVGLDCHSIDRFGAEGYPAHRIILGAGMLILEGIDLAAVQPGRYLLAAIPLKIQHAEASPVRAVLLE